MKDIHPINLLVLLELSFTLCGAPVTYFSFMLSEWWYGRTQNSVMEVMHRTNIPPGSSNSDNLSLTFGAWRSCKKKKKGKKFWMTCCHSTPIKYFPRRQETLRLWTLIPCYKCIFSYRANMTNWKGSKCFLNHVQHPRFTALSRGCKQELNIWLDSCWTLRPPLLSGFYSHVKRHTFLKEPVQKKNYVMMLLYSNRYDY